MDAMIAEQKQAAKDHRLELTDEQTFYEVVADACQRMLLDTNAGQRLAEFGVQSKQNQSIVQDVIQWIRDILEKLRNIFADVDPDSLAAQEFAKFDASVKQILADMYVDMTIDAGENLAVIKKAFGSNTQVSKKENKLDATEGKYRLKQLQEQGVAFKLPAIKTNTTESERYEKLKDVTIDVPTDDRSVNQSDAIKSLSELGDRAKSKAEKIILPLIKGLKIDGNKFTENKFTANDVDIEFIFSLGNAGESISKQLRYGGNYADFTKAILNLDKILNNSVLIEKHKDKYIGTIREDKNLESVSVLFGAFKDGGYIIPVQMEIKKLLREGGRLYMTVAMTKIEASVLGKTVDKNRASTLIPASITFRLADIFKEINPQDMHFLKYLPDQFLSDAQIAAKQNALKEDEDRIAKYRNIEATPKKLPVNEDTSPRTLLTKALDSVITDPVEKQKLQEYRENIEKMNEQEAKLRDLKSQIKDLSFAPGPRDTQKIKVLREEAAKTEICINLYDNRPLRFEASE